jgi:hypothetical protein
MIGFGNTLWYTFTVWHVCFPQFSISGSVKTQGLLFGNDTLWIILCTMESRSREIPEFRTSPIRGLNKAILKRNNLEKTSRVLEKNRNVSP